MEHQRINNSNNKKSKPATTTAKLAPPAPPALEEKVPSNNNSGSNKNHGVAAAAHVKAAEKEPPQTSQSISTKATIPATEAPPKKPASPAPRKKKAAYVPPAPITAPVLAGKSEAEAKAAEDASKQLAAEDPSLSLGEESSLVFLGGDSVAINKQKKEEIDDEEDSLSLGIGEDASEEGFGDNNGFSQSAELNLATQDFAETAISVVTSMTTQTKESSSRADTASVISHFEYPDEPPEPSSKSGKRFDELYRLKGVLGTGAFSTVREGFHRSDAQISYAVKCINRKKLSVEDEAALLDEVSILKELKHEHIIRLFDFFEEPSTYYLVMERMRGGELFDRIVAKAYYNEKEARDTCKIVLEAVRYCHENHVAHRDLKPENLLLLSDVDDSAVKIADFGFAKKVYKPNSLTTQCGTPGYVAPEILEGTAYDERSDMWSVGVILYILLGGYPPFIESTQRDLFRKIRKGDYEFHEEYWGTVSAEAKDLISSLLTVSCTDRLTAEDALDNAWILGDDAKLASKDLGSNLTKLRNFNGKRKFRAAVSTIIAVNKLNLMGKEFFTNLKARDDSAEIEINN